MKNQSTASNGHVSALIRRIFLLTILLLYALPAFSAKDDTDYELLAQIGTYEEIEAGFKRNSSLKGQVFGSDRETFLMLCLKANRSSKIIDLCIKAECNINARTKSKKTPLMYAAQYSSDPNVVETIVKTGKVLPASMKKRVLEKDAEGKTAFDYALQNVQANTYEVLSRYAQDPAGNNAPSQSAPSNAADQSDTTGEEQALSKEEKKAKEKAEKQAAQEAKKAAQEEAKAREKEQKLAEAEAKKAEQDAAKAAKQAEKEAKEAANAEKQAKRKKTNPDTDKKTGAAERATSVNSSYVVPQVPIDDEEEAKPLPKAPETASAPEKNPSPEAEAAKPDEEATTVRPASATYTPTVEPENKAEDPAALKNISQPEEAPKVTIKESEPKSAPAVKEESEDEQSTYAALRDGTQKPVSKIVLPEVPAPEPQKNETKPSQSAPLASPLPRTSEVKPYTQSFLYDFALEDESDDEDEPVKGHAIKDPDAPDANGVTLLMKAAKAGNDWDVRNLLENGANVQLRDKDGWSALMYAVRYQNSMQLVNMLVAHGAHIRVRNKYNATPLLLASDYSQNPEILSLLLRNRSASEDEVFRAFVFALTSNAGQDHIKTAKIQLFLDMDIPLNRIWKGKTPLMYACQYASSNAVIKQLLDAGARTGIQDASGKTAFDYAKANTNLVHDDIYWSLNGAR